MGEEVFVMGRSPICESSSPPLHTSNCTNFLSYSTAAVSVFAYLHKEPHGRRKTIIRSIALKIY